VEWSKEKTPSQNMSKIYILLMNYKDGVATLNICGLIMLSVNKFVG
jgi:hypothetical protein